MSFDPNSIDPSKVRELIAKGLVIDSQGIRADYLETSTDPEVAKRELAALAELARQHQQKIPDHVQEELRVLDEWVVPQRPEALEQAIDNYFMTHKRDIAPSSQKTYRSALNVFTRLMGGGERKVHSILAADCAKYAEALALIPAHATKKGIELGSVDDVLANPPGGDLPRLSSGSIRDQLNILDDFCEWAVASQRHFGPNPMEGVPRPTVSDADREGAEAFTREELEKIFAPEKFRDFKRPHLLWGPLLALFTGARANEIAQLRLQDFGVEDGVPFIEVVHLNPRKPENKGGPRTKNTFSRRKIPLHPTVQAVGLNAYLDDLRAIGADRLFPNLPLMDGKREKYLSRDFNDNYLRKKLGLVSREKVFHSFRDTFVTAVVAAKVNQAVIDQWMGHAPGSVQARNYVARYGVKELADMMFSDLDFSKTAYKPGEWNDWLKGNMVP